MYCKQDIIRDCLSKIYKEFREKERSKQRYKEFSRLKILQGEKLKHNNIEFFCKINKEG